MQAKLSALQMAPKLMRGGLIAHHTATLPGVAASPLSPKSVVKLMRFKQRPGPFLLLADSAATAMSLARYVAPELRRLAARAWPGPTTLVFAAKPGLPACCYKKGTVAVRVDASIQTRKLAAKAGGLLISSSLNRKGKSHAEPDFKLFMRQRRFLSGCASGAESSGKASVILRVRRNGSTIIRQ